MNEASMQKKNLFLFMNVVAPARECALSLWDVLDFTILIYGQQQEIAALTVSHYCDHSQSIPLSGCTWYWCTGVSRKCVARRQQLVVRQVCASLCGWSKGSTISSLRHGPGKKEVALCTAFPMPTKEVDTFF